MGAHSGRLVHDAWNETWFTTPGTRLAGSRGVTHSSRSRKRSRWSSVSWALPLVLLLGLAASYFAWPAFREFVQEAYGVVATGDDQRIRSWVRGYGSWGVVVLLALMFLQAIVAVLPSIATMVAAILAYGPLWGGALAWGGMMLTGSFMYGVGHLLGQAAVERFLGEKSSRRVEDIVERYGSWAVVIARLTPVSSSDAVSFIAGALSMGYFRFLLAMGLGTLPLTVLIAWLGQDTGRLKLGLGILSGVAIVAFLAHLAWQRWFSSSKRGDSAPSDRTKPSRSEHAGQPQSAPLSE